MKSGFDKLEAYLSEYDRFVISTHESPDADGLGAEIAFLEFLRWLGKTAVIINSDPMPDNVRFIDVDGEINIAKNGFPFRMTLMNMHSLFLIPTITIISVPPTACCHPGSGTIL